MNIYNITSNITSNITRIVNSSSSSSTSYTTLIISATIFISVALVSLVIKTKCDSASDVFDIINIFK